MIQNDRRVTLREISSELGTSYGSVHHFVSDMLLYSKTVLRNHPRRHGSMDRDFIHTKTGKQLRIFEQRDPHLNQVESHKQDYSVPIKIGRSGGQVTGPPYLFYESDVITLCGPPWVPPWTPRLI
ncbi:uncharacterized protein TNCV_1264121 [Trichonephila clavipes]|nr:uncharacterized protein TNCV_1264121 [Trichonephila clavipes]